MNFLKHYIKKMISLAKRLSRKFAKQEISEDTIQREKEIAVETLKKGENFIRTALLLRKNNSDENVVLSMICQGIENILKGLLLSKDYVRYEPLLRRKFGKNLLRLYYRTTKEYRIIIITTQMLK